MSPRPEAPLPPAAPARRSPFGVGLAVAALAVLADRLSKLWLLDGVDIARVGPVEVLPFFDLVMVWNRGVSFGMFQSGDEAGRWMLIGLALAISAVLVVWMWRADSGRLAVALGLVVGGALSNVHDRFIYGAVADFFLLHAGEWRFPAFNLADSAITVGVALLLLDSLLAPGEAKRAGAQPPNGSASGGPGDDEAR